jgi:hypothetical protein
MTDDHDAEPVRRPGLARLGLWAALGALAAVLITVAVLSAHRPSVPTLTPGQKSAAAALGDWFA